MRSYTRARPPTLHAFLRSAIKANVVGSPHSLNYRGPGSSSRPRDLPPASADPDHTHFTTFTIVDGETPYADDLAGHPQTTYPAIRRQPKVASRRPCPAIRKQTTLLGHPQADDLAGPSASRRPCRAIRKQARVVCMVRSSLSSVDDITGGTSQPSVDDHRPSVDGPFHGALDGRHH